MLIQDTPKTQATRRQDTNTKIPNRRIQKEKERPAGGSCPRNPLLENPPDNPESRQKYITGVIFQESDPPEADALKSPT